MSLPEGWELVKLKSIATVSSGIGFPKKYQGKDSGDFPFYKVSDISVACKNNKAVLEYANNYISEVERLELKGKILKKGSTLFAKIGEALKLNRRAFLREEGLADNNIMSVKSILSDMDKYLYYYLKTVDMSLLSRSTTIPSIRKGDIENLLFPLPPLIEQKHIAERLDKLLARVEHIKIALDNTPLIIKRFRKSVLSSAVGGRLSKGKDWESLTIDNILENIRYGTSKKCSYDDNLTPVLRIPNIGDKGIDIKDIKGATFNEKEFETLSLKIGDILIIRSNGSIDLVGKNVVVTNEHEDYIFAGYLIRIRLNLTLANPKYIHYVLSSPEIREIINITAKSTTGINNLNAKEIGAFKIPLPSLKEQKEIVKKVETLFAIADKMEANITEAQKRVDRLTQSILAKAFRGEL